LLIQIVNNEKNITVVKLRFLKWTWDFAGAGVNQAAGRQLAIATLDFLASNNSVALVREQTIPTERPPLLGEVNANCLRIERVSRGQ
jgi:hypothetical protein